MFPKEIFSLLIQRISKNLMSKYLLQMLSIKKSPLKDLIKLLGRGFGKIFKDLKVNKNLELKFGTKVEYY